MKNKFSYFLEEILANFYSTNTKEKFYFDLDLKLKEHVAVSNFSEEGEGEEDFGPYGSLILPYSKMGTGTITSLQLFGLDELIIFTFYWANATNYKKVADVGANIGLHSILMSRCNWDVEAYEPDPNHVIAMKKNIKINKATNINVNKMAVSGFNGSAEFTKVLGNTTGSHLTGAKSELYGGLKKFKVVVKDIKDLMLANDLIKLDVEGEEANIITSTVAESWDDCDMIVEVGSVSNAIAIFNHLSISVQGINLFSQKNNWSKIESLSQMPFSWREGSLFITRKASFPIQK